MDDLLIAGCLANQFDEAFDVLAGAVEKFTPEQWTAGRSPFDGPARATLHALQCAEFYPTLNEEIFKGHGDLDTPVWEMEEHELPTQEEMQDYLEKTRLLTVEWLARLANEELFSQPADVPDTQMANLEWAIYALRHLQHHTGEVCSWQKQFNIPQTQWE